MVYLIDYVLPESYFAQNLQALSVDIAVFRHLLLAKLPRLSHHLDALQLKAGKVWKFLLFLSLGVANGPVRSVFRKLIFQPQKVFQSTIPV